MPEWLTPLFSLIGTLAGTFGGILAANKLTNYRIDLLENRIKAVDELDKRVDNLDLHQVLQDEQIRVLQVDVSALKEGVKL